MTRTNLQKKNLPTSKKKNVTTIKEQQQQRKEEKVAKDMILQPIVQSILDNKGNNTAGRLNYGKYKEIVNKSKVLLPYLTMNLLKK